MKRGLYIAGGGGGGYKGRGCMIFGAVPYYYVLFGVMR